MPVYIIKTYELWCQPVRVLADDLESAVDTANGGFGDGTVYAPYYVSCEGHSADENDLVHPKDVLPSTQVEQLLYDLRRLAPQLTPDQYALILAELTLVPALNGDLL